MLKSYVALGRKACKALVLIGVSVVAFGPQALAAEKEVVVSQSAGADVRWILPGLRRLDPTVFGTPDKPLGFEADIGVPLAARRMNDDGTAYTTTAGPTPMSDNFKRITGSFQARLVDRTPVDIRASRDSAEAEYRFSDPTGTQEYRVVLKKVIPVGPVHQFFGGVLIDGYLHGKSSFGTRLQPTLYNYAALWGVAELYVNGVLVSNNRLVHMMSTERVRSSDDDGYRLLFDNELPHKGVHTHLLLPNTIVTPEGPRPEPVPTGFTLPNGAEQPFIHILFEETQVEGLDLLE